MEIDEEGGEALHVGEENPDLARTYIMSPAQIRRARYLLSMTQKDLAERLGVTRIAVVRWEQGTKKPRAMLVLALREIWRQRFNGEPEF